MNKKYFSLLLLIPLTMSFVNPGVHYLNSTYPVAGTGVMVCYYTSAIITCPLSVNEPFFPPSGNVLYETTGNISYGVPYRIPAATGNFYGELKIGF